MGKKQIQKIQGEARPKNVEERHPNSDEDLERQRRNFEKLQILRGEEKSHSGKKNKKNQRAEMYEENSKKRSEIGIDEDFLSMRRGSPED